MMLGGTFKVPATSMLRGTCTRSSWKPWGVEPLMVVSFIASNGASAQPISVGDVSLSNKGSMPVGKLLCGGAREGIVMIDALMSIACVTHGPPHGAEA